MRHLKKIQSISELALCLYRPNFQTKPPQKPDFLKCGCELRFRKTCATPFTNAPKRDVWTKKKAQSPQISIYTTANIGLKKGRAGALQVRPIEKRDF